MRSIRDFRAFILLEADVSSFEEFRAHGSFIERGNFLRKLHHLWNLEEVPAESVPDVDAVTMLTDDQWDQFAAELHSILTKT